jgi:hypothetical protein
MADNFKRRYLAAEAELRSIINELPNSRERSSAFTKLDEGRHWVFDLADQPAEPVVYEPLEG